MNKETTRRVWAAVTRNPRASSRELVRDLGLSSVSVLHYHLAQLSEAGYIRRGGRRAIQIVVPLVEVTR